MLSPAARPAVTALLETAGRAAAPLSSPLLTFTSSSSATSSAAAAAAPALATPSSASASLFTTAGDAGLPEGVDCTCEPATCECDKTCFCGVRTTPYAGARRAPPAGLTALGALPAAHDCACSIGEVGGPGIADSSNTVDCDCLAAPCDCSRRCTCSPPPAPDAAAAPDTAQTAAAIAATQPAVPA